MKHLGPTLDSLLRSAKIRKSDFAAKCGLSPSVITKILQGKSYSDEMAGRVISGFDELLRQAELLAAHLEDVKVSTGITNDLVTIDIRESPSSPFKVPYYLRHIFQVLAQECQHDTDLEVSLRYLASRFEDFNKQELSVAEDKPNEPQKQADP